MLSNTSLLFCYSSQTSLFSESSRTSRISWIKGFTIIFEGTRSQNCPKTWEFWEIYLPWNYREISIKQTPGYSGHFFSGTAGARYRQIWLQLECKLWNCVKNARIRSFSCQMMEKYWRKNSFYPEIAQAVTSPSPKPMHLRASTAIGKEELSIQFFHRFYVKVSFSKNQYRQQVFQNS